MKKCIIYDCDGVLVDSEILASRVDSKMLTAFGCPISEEQCTRLFLGKNAASIREIILEEFNFVLSPQQHQQIHEKIFEAFDSYLIPLIGKSISHYKQLKVAQCVASNSNKNWIYNALKVTNLHHHFDESAIFYSAQVKQGKPAPDLFLFAANQMGSEPTNCVVVEDSPSGIEAALAAGMQVIGFTGGAHAQYSWYSEQLKAYNIPIAKNEAELHQLLETSIS